MISKNILDFLYQDNIWPYLLIQDTEFLQQILSSNQVPLALQNGKICAQTIRAQYPSQPVEEILFALNVKISYSDEPVKVFNRYRRAVYEKHPPEVTLFLQSIPQLESLAIDYQLNDLASDRVIKELMLAHELYHHLQPQILPQVKRQYRQIWFQIGPFKVYRFIQSLNEITAHSFSKELCQVKTPPFILDLLTTHQTSTRISTLIKKAIELSKITPIPEEIYAYESI